MLNTEPVPYPVPPARRPWDARLARRLVTPLIDSWVTPNHLTTLRLVVGLAAAAAFVPGTYGWSNIAALLLILSNFLDHTDGELARMSGKTSRIGHLYDLASDAAVTILLFVAIGVGVAAKPGTDLMVAARDIGPGGRFCDRADFLSAHAHRGAVGQGRDPAGFARRVRDRGCAVPAAPGHAQQCSGSFAASRPRFARRCMPSGW